MKRFLLLALIISIAFSVRTIGLNFGLPFAYHDDEPIIVNYALSYGTGDFSPRTFNIPPLLSYLLYFEYGIFYLIGLLLGIFSNINDFGYLFLNNPTAFYLIGRFTYGVLPGTLSVFFLYLLGKKVFNKQVGLIAAFFLAVNFLHVRDSHYIYFDIPLTMFLIILFAKSADLIRTNALSDYVWMGILTGIVTAIKYFGLLLAPFLTAVLVHNFFVYRDKPLQTLSRAGTLILVSAATFFILNPYVLLQYQRFLRTFTHIPASPQDIWFHLKVSLLGSLGLPMLCCSLFGIFAAAVRKNKVSWLLSVFVASYYFIIMLRSQRAERYVMPLVPLLLLFAGYLIHILTEHITQPLGKKAVLILISCLLVALPSYKIFLTDRLFLMPDTRTQAYHWIKGNIPSSSAIAMDAVSSWFPRLEKDKKQVRQIYDYSRDITFEGPKQSLDFKKQLILSNPRYPKKTYFLYYMRESRIRGFHSVYPDIPIDFDELIRRNIEYVVISSILCGERHQEFARRLKARSEFLQSFSPYLKGVKRIKPEEDTALPAAAFSLKELKARKSFGPYIEVYKIIK